MGSKYIELINIDKTSNKEENESDNFKDEIKLSRYKNKLNKNNLPIIKENNAEDLLKDSDSTLDYEYGVFEKEERVSFESTKGCISKDRTKTHLLNNSSTKETNIKKYIKKEIEEIVNYLNSKINTKYKASSKNTIKLITARLREGFSIDDFKTVIDKKFKAWVRTEYEQYLTPFTLFGHKFEQYLNQKVVCNTSKQKNSYEKINNYERPKLRFDNFKGRDYDYAELERKLLGW